MDKFDPAVSVWRYKPWWCQPWSIALTGCSAIAAFVLFIPWWWLKLGLAAPVAVWMGFFLLVWPRLMQDYLTQLSQSGEDP
jgi:hypothetical protein